MATNLRPVAVDFGSSSVRVITATFAGTRIELAEAARFPHQPRLDSSGLLVWDIPQLVAQVQGALLALIADDAITSVAVDTWGVDHALVDAAGRPVFPFACYRDPRTQFVAGELALAGITDGYLWAQTGTKPDPILTSYQLKATLAELGGGGSAASGGVSSAASNSDGPVTARDVGLTASDDDALDQIARVARVARVLMLPDYVATQLGAAPGWSQGICSTSGLTKPGAKKWNTQVMSAFGIPRGWFGPITPERTVAGQLTLAGREYDIPIMSAGSHDTACAIHALPTWTGAKNPHNRAFLASGSWSMVGIETDQPVLTPAVLAAGFTNEARVDGGNRLLGNLTGLWILQECVRQWAREGTQWDWSDLTAAASAAHSAGVIIDTDAPDLQLPGDIPARIRTAVQAAGGRHPETPGEIVRVVLESLAASYARALTKLLDLTGARPEYLAIVGGGTRQSLLNQLTADACGIPVVVGSAEATSLGSIIAQLETVGAIPPDAHDAVIAASCDIQVIAPKN